MPRPLRIEFPGACYHVHLCLRTQEADLGAFMRCPAQDGIAYSRGK